jgi:hypothetical protein
MLLEVFVCHASGEDGFAVVCVRFDGGKGACGSYIGGEGGANGGTPVTGGAGEEGAGGGGGGQHGRLCFVGWVGSVVMGWLWLASARKKSASNYLRHNS